MSEAEVEPLAVPQQCSECKYCRKTTWHCLRYPPAMLFGAHFMQPGDNVPNAVALYPKVRATDWCGEFVKGVFVAPLPILPDEEQPT